MARLVFLGSPEVAVPSLRALLAAGHEVAVVVSQPDKRRGRGATLVPSSVKEAATDAGLMVTDRMDDVLGTGAELGVVVAYGRLVPARILDVLPMLNAHFSLLPRWRGAAPVERAILAGDEVTGVSIMRLEAGLDTGPVLMTRSELVHNEQREHVSALRTRLASVAAELLVEVLSEGADALPEGEPQSGEATYAPKIEPEELRLEFSRGVVELERVVRLDRAWTTFRGERLRVLDAARIQRGETASSNLSSRDSSCDDAGDAEPGTLCGTRVKAADGSLELLTVQPAGRRAQSASEWTRGARLSPGERLGD